MKDKAKQKQALIDLMKLDEQPSQSVEERALDVDGYRNEDNKSLNDVISKLKFGNGDPVEAHDFILTMVKNIKGATGQAQTFKKIMDKTNEIQDLIR